MKKSLMTPKNWAIVAFGIFTTFFGYALIAPISTNYDGAYAFTSIFITVLGLVIVIAGLAIGFEKKEDEESTKE